RKNSMCPATVPSGVVTRSMPSSFCQKPCSANSRRKRVSDITPSGKNRPRLAMSTCASQRRSRSLSRTGRRMTCWPRSIDTSAGQPPAGSAAWSRTPAPGGARSRGGAHTGGRSAPGGPSAPDARPVRTAVQPRVAWASGGGGDMETTLTVTSVTIGAPDPRALADFYARLLGTEVRVSEPSREGEPPEAGWAQLKAPDGPTLNFEYERSFDRPVWPAEPGRQNATQ